MAKGGSIGGISLIQAGIGTCALSRDVIAIHTDPTKIDSTYLVAFLLSRVGQLQLDRNKSQQVQAHLTFPAIGNVKVIVPSRAKQSAVAELVAKALSEQAQSQDLYTEAQTLLATELGLEKLDLSESLHSVRRALDVQASDRADAEYYKPKYQRLLDHIAATGQGVRLGDWVTEPIRRGIQPDYAEDDDVVIINSQHVGKTHIELDNNRFAQREFFQRGTNRRALVHKYDVLLNSTGYITIGRCQILLDDIHAAVDGHISIIRPKQGLDPVYLSLFLNTTPGQLQTERGWTGSSSQIELRTDVIANFIIWRAPSNIQKQLRQLVEQSHQARQEAQRLLADVKAAVEQLIEGK